MEHTNVLLYSKFSPASRKFIETIESNDSLENHFTLLCIDNKKTRERIVKSAKLNVKEVPSILRVYQDTGFVECFEGEKAFQLLNKYVKEIQKQSQKVIPMAQMTPMNPVSNVVPMSQMTPMNPVSNVVPMAQMTPMNPVIPSSNMTSISQFPQQHNIQQNDQNSQMNQTNQQVSQLLPESQPRHDSIQKQQKLINSTSIDELGSDINRGQTVNTYMHVPKSVEFDIDIENRQRTVKTDRSVKTNDSGNIVTRAMQMQKEREQESSMPLGPRSLPMS